MARMTAPHLKALLTRYPDHPKVFCESGTFHGKTTRLAVDLFAQVHTIELHPEWYAEAVRDLTPLGVTCYYGNSATVIPQLCAAIAEPVFWYLDGHFFRRTDYEVAGEKEGLPLWRELEGIATREHRDIIVVDDVASFGKSDPTPEWLDVSLEKIAGYFPDRREAVILLDQAVVYR